MSNSLKKLTVSIIAVIAAIMLAFGALTMERVFAETAEGLVMDDGAYVRLEKDSSGIRFQAEIKDYDESKEYGMLIAPKWLIDSCKTTDYITELEELNPGKELAICGVVKEENGKHIITGALANLRYDNLNLVWTGIAFEKTTTEEGVSYKYATVNKAGDNERSIVSVASGALNAGTETDADNIEILNTFINRAANKMNGVAEANKDDKANISVTIGETEKYNRVGEFVQVSATVTPAIDAQVKYVSSNKDVATIDGDGTVKTVGGGETTITASVAGISAEKDIIVYDKIISTAEDVESYFRENRMTAKYAVLANDIDMSGKGRIDNYTQNFSGVFDGREHTISNMKTGFGLVFKMTGGTIKNVTFTNYGYAGGAENGYNSGIIGGIWGDNYTLDNVHFTAYQMSAPSVASGLIARDHCAEAATVIKNSTFDITCYAGSEEVPVMLFHDSNYRSTIMENVTVNYTGTLVKFGETGTGYGGDGEMTFGEKVTHTNVTLIDKRDYTEVKYAKGYIVGSGNKIELDVAKFSAEFGTITEFKANGAVCAFTSENGKLIVDISSFGMSSFVVKNSDNRFFLFSLTIADKVISTAEEFVDYWREDGMTAKYTVLANDIDLSGKDTIANWTQNFSNVFDGLNNKITGMTTRHGLIYKMTGGTIKNVTFDDYRYEGQDGAGVVGNIWADGYTLENVHFKATQTGAPVTASGLIAKNHSAEPIIIKDCTFDITCYAGSEEVPVMLFHDSNYRSTIMENVTVNYTGTLVKFGETGTGYDGAGEKVFGEKVTRTNVTLTDKRDAK